jgi:hypothetical protein
VITSAYALCRVFRVLDAPQFFALEGNATDRLEIAPVTYGAWLR